MADISKILNSDGIPYNIKDDRASHYLGRINSDNTPITANITLVTGVTVTAKINDWIVLQTKSDAFIWNGTEWMSFGGRGTDALAELVDDGAKNLLHMTNYTVGQIISKHGRNFEILSDGGIKITGTNPTSTYADLYFIGDWVNREPLLDLTQTPHKICLTSDTTISTPDDIYIRAYDRRSGSTDAAVTASLATQSNDVSMVVTTIFITVQPSADIPQNGIIIYPMICTKAEWDISQKYVPYAMSNPELTAAEKQNKNNISYNTNMGVKNLSRWNSGSSSQAQPVMASQIPFTSDGGEYTISYNTALTTGTIAIGFKDSGGNATTTVEIGNASKIKTVTIPANTAYFNIYTLAYGDYSNFMICPKSLYATDPTYQPYALPNSELTVLSAEDRATLVELVDSGAKNIAAPLDVASREDLTITNDNGQYTITGTITRSFTGYLFRPAEPLQLTTDCIIIGAEQLTGLVYLVAYRQTAGSNMKFDIIGTQNKILPSGAIISYIYVQQNNAETAISAKINLMLCTVADYAISPKFVPYRPSYQEIYETNKTYNTYLINGATAITANTDLNTLLTPGIYTCASSVIAATLTNCPHTASGFRVDVIQTSSANDKKQILQPNQMDIVSSRYERSYSTSANAFSSWYKFDGTAVT